MISNSIEELTAEYRVAMEWIEKSTGKKLLGRLINNLKILDASLRTHYQLSAGKKVSVADRELERQLVLISTDVRMVLDIYAAFGKDPADGILCKKLREMQSGPNFMKDEQPDNQSSHGRNTQFELVTSGLLKRGGFPQAPIVDREDTSHFLGKRLTFTECKRVYSRTAFDKQVRRGKKQLVHAFEIHGDQSARGIIALDGSRMLNAGDKVMVVDNGAHGREQLYLFAKKVLDEDLKTNLPPNVLGVLVYLSTQMDVNGKFSIGSFWTFWANKHIDFDSRLLVDKLEGAFSKLEH